MKLIFATRPSALALWQTRWVMQALQETHPGLLCEEKVIQTQADDTSYSRSPRDFGKGLFTHALESALLSGTVHCAVHSLKDLPIVTTSGLEVACLPNRSDVRDVLISPDSYTLNTLPAGAVVGTSSLRRSAQLQSIRPDLHILPIHGNIDTRIRKAQQGQYHAIILAGAGLIRLGLESHISQWLPLEVMLPAPGQGALAVQCRLDDQETLALLSVLDDHATRLAVTAERQFLLALGGGCALPVAAYASLSGIPPEINLSVMVASADGKRLIKLAAQGQDPIELGDKLAHDAIELGASELLATDIPGFEL